MNPGRAERFGERAYPDVASIPEAVDHAFIMVPAKAVAPAIEQCCAKGVPVVTIFTDGFAETGEAGRRQQQELITIARAGGVRIIGPNCIGLLSLHDRFVLTVNAVLVQRMECGLAEVILGFKRDPQVGPIVVLGVGGILAEIYRDFALRLAPVDVATASSMIEEVKGLAVIRGYRGMPRGARASGEHLLAARSRPRASRKPRSTRFSSNAKAKASSRWTVSLRGATICDK